MIKVWIQLTSDLRDALVLEDKDADWMQEGKELLFTGCLRLPEPMKDRRVEVPIRHILYVEYWPEDSKDAGSDS